VSAEAAPLRLSSHDTPDVGAEDGPARRVTARLWPPVAAPWPGPAAVVCEGAAVAALSAGERYARRLASHGIAALLLDSHAARGLSRAPHLVRLASVGEAMMLADAFAARAALARLDGVDPGRIGVVGLGHGGTAALLCAYASVRRRFCAPGEGFAAHVAVAPASTVRLVDYRTTGAPVAILAAERDAAVDPVRLDLIAGDLLHGGSPVRRLTLAGAGHGFDAGGAAPRRGLLDLSRFALRIDLSGRTLSERTGRPVRGRTARLAALLRAARAGGCPVAPDAAARSRAEAFVLEALETASGTAGDGRPRPTAGHAGGDRRLHAAPADFRNVDPSRSRP